MKESGLKKTSPPRKLVLKEKKRQLKSEKRKLSNPSKNWNEIMRKSQLRSEPMIVVIEIARGVDQEMEVSTKTDALIAHDREEKENLRVAVAIQVIIRGWKMEEIDGEMIGIDERVIEIEIETDVVMIEIVGATIEIEEAMIVIVEQVETGIETSI